MKLFTILYTICEINAMTYNSKEKKDHSTKLKNFRKEHHLSFTKPIPEFPDLKKV
jgi:hypothetical protein